MDTNLGLGMYLTIAHYSRVANSISKKHRVPDWWNYEEDILKPEQLGNGGLPY